jgi:hypothetical protein
MMFGDYRVIAWPVSKRLVYLRAVALFVLRALPAFVFLATDRVVLRAVLRAVFLFFAIYILLGLDT